MYSNWPQVAIAQQLHDLVQLSPKTLRSSILLSSAIWNQHFHKKKKKDFLCIKSPTQLDIA